ncbi:MAG: hypothetical protein AAGF93_06585 [Cyanobacteria bacterium P01_H01_bin.105]
MALLLILSSCGSLSQTSQSSSVEPSKTALLASRPTIEQVEVPALIKTLEPWLDTYVPQVQISQPQADQVFDDTTINVSLRVQDLPIYKDERWNMGPHLELLLDNQPYSSIYDLEQPVVLKDLAPGTHTIRVFAERPWHESFKNEGAYTQVTFHIFAKTDENTPGIDQPLLTYGAPSGTYGAEPVLLDFYLTEAPLHQVAQDNPRISDWQIRYTINGDSLTLNTWEPIYIEGLKPGQNWVQLTLIDETGEPIEGVFNNTVRLIEYDPTFNDTLAKIIQDDLTLEEVGGILDPTYEPPLSETAVPETLDTLDSDIQDINKGDGIDSESENDSIVDVISPEVTETDVTEPEKNESEATGESGNSLDKSSSTEATDNNTVDNQMIERPTLDSRELEIESRETPAILDDSLDDSLLDDSLTKVDPKVVPSDVISPENSDQSVGEPEVTNPPASIQESSDVLVDKTDTSIETKTDLDLDSSLDIDPEPNSTNVDGQDDEEEDVSPSKKKYFQRLYEYRDRSMQTYGR